ncbi:phage protease [Shewanella algae]|uniref:phage protease n=1 Tax=Shewanella algae TaxID=38313 RepID=UPI001AACA971|nr:phage protease [Shewanella algae]MBO2670030.1 phage protease [Shewanella algae]
MSAKSTTKALAIGFAALSSQLTTATAAAFVVAQDGYIQALPDGQFASVDGRPSDVPSGKWLMDEVAFAAMQANTPHKAGDLVIDYEHQTLNKEKNGQPAPAAGWFNIDDVQYRQGEGLFIKPRFTDNAIAYLSASEYKYFSLVFGYDKTTGRPQFIHSAALTNRPGVDGMLPLATLSAQLEAAQRSGLSAESIANWTQPTQPEELNVNPLLKKLLAALGIELDAEATEVTAEQEQAALTALDDLGVAAASIDGLNQRIAALSATQGNQIDLNEYVPVGVANALREQLVALTAENGALTVEQTVKTAINEGKAFACEEEYLISLGKQSMAALTANLDARKPLAALTAKQTTTVPAPKEQDTKLAALSAEEKQLAKAWGMSEDEFAKAKAADKE